MKQEFGIDLDIYPERIINQAISDFKEVGEIKLNDNKLAITGENKEEIEEIFKEFINYCIGLINE